MRPANNHLLAALFFLVIAGLLAASVAPLWRPPAASLGVGIQDDLDNFSAVVVRPYVQSANPTPTWVTQQRFNTPGVLFLGQPPPPSP